MTPKLKTALLVGIPFLFSCRETPPVSNQSVPAPSLTKAVYVLNEGNFGDPAGARLTLYDAERDTVYTNVFEAANNNSHLGSVGDDMKIAHGRAYLLMSGSENLNVISLDNHVLLQAASFPGATPHDLLIDTVRNKAFVTRLYSSSILVLNLSSLAVIDSIPVGNNPQGLTIVGNNLFVCNSGYGSSKTVSVVDLSADTVRKTLGLGDGPTNAALAPDGRLWVVCTGNAFGNPPTVGKVYVINTSALTVEDSVVLGENLWGSIVMGDRYAYVLGIASGSFYGGPLHRISFATKNASMRFVNGVFYGMAVDDVTGDLYLADAKNFNTNGEILIYTKDGALKKRFTAQRGPSVIAFKR